MLHLVLQSIYLVFKYLQGWSFQHLPAQPVAVLSHEYRAIFSSVRILSVQVMSVASFLPFAAHPCCRCLHNPQRTGAARPSLRFLRAETAAPSPTS